VGEAKKEEGKVEEKCLLRIKEFIKEHKKLTVVIIIVAILAFIVGNTSHKHRLISFFLLW
jgi:hypothetical protein